MSTNAALRRERRIAADPTSLALLLAGPTSIDLWPGARRRGESAGQVLVEAQLPGVTDQIPALVLVRAGAPRRTPLAFVVSFGWAGEPDSDGPLIVGGDGTLALGYDGVADTHAKLAIVMGDESRVRMVEAMADGFLDNLAATAEARSRAA